MRGICLFLICASAFAAPSAQLLPKAPVRFERNQGQAGPSLLWSARGPGYSIGFTQDATLLRVGERTVAMRFPGQNAAAPFAAAHPFSVPTNYVTSRYQGNVPAYGRLRRHQVYPGIDVVYYGNGDNLEYDFEIAAGADPSLIRMRFDGADELQLAAGGDLAVRVADKTLTQHLPVVYQSQASGERIVLPAAYRIGANHEVTFALAPYDVKAPLVIDPVISFATYPSGSGSDVGIAIARDQYGFIYLGGTSSSTDYPNLNGGVDVNRGGQDAFVMKLNPNANSGAEVVQYASYYGGGGVDSLKAMAVDPTGLIYLTGTTNSSDLVTRSNAYKTTIGGGTTSGIIGTDAFVVFLDPARSGSLTLVYATYLGGTDYDEATAITYFDGKIYVTGSTSSYDFPLVKPYQPGRAPGRDMFVTEIDPNQSGSASLVGSTYFGGAGSDYAYSLAVDAPGHVFVAGSTTSRDFPVSPNAYQSTPSGAGDGFLTEFYLHDAAGGYSTYLGGAGVDAVRRMVLEPSGRIALAGYSGSRDFPVTQNAVQPLLGGDGAINAFLTVLDIRAAPANALTYSTFYGGRATEIAWDLKRDAQGKYYVGGYSFSENLPVSQNALSPVTAKAGLNGFIAVIDPSAPPVNALSYASYITGPGSQVVFGVDVDANGSIYLTGYATSDIFPAGFQAHKTPGNSDSFVLVFKP